MPWPNLPTSSLVCSRTTKLIAAMNTLNFNVGVLGHVDSGKTSLAEALSTVASTAAFDKNPQSKQRGITLDLGFSSFTVEAPHHLTSRFRAIQYTLVDCPGHASLIRTVIGGAQIIDLMLLVIDVAKGMQTQTAECLILGEITCSHLIVVLNKTDTIDPDNRSKVVEKLTKKMALTLSKTKFRDASIVACAAHPQDGHQPSGLDTLIETLKKNTFIPERSDQGTFLMAVDHCFSIRGQGTVMTGTVLQGVVAVNDVIEVPSIREQRKVKSIQMFRQSVSRAIQGDRVGVCVTQFDSSKLERGLLCSPGSLPSALAVVASISKIPYFKAPLSTRAKYHVSLGHETVMANIILFSKAVVNDSPELSFNPDSDEYNYLETLGAEDQEPEHNGAQTCFALLDFERAIAVPSGSQILGSKLDADIHKNSCRLAFQGRICKVYESKDAYTSQIKIVKKKEKHGLIERMNNEYELIGKNMFKKDSNIQRFVGFKVHLSTGELGILDGPFGQSGKFKVRLTQPLSPSTVQLLASSGKVKKRPPEGVEGAGTQPPPSVALRFKRYLFDKSMAQ